MTTFSEAPRLMGCMRLTPRPGDAPGLVRWKFFTQVQRGGEPTMPPLVTVGVDRYRVMEWGWVYSGPAGDLAAMTFAGMREEQPAGVLAAEPPMGVVVSGTDRMVTVAREYAQSIINGARRNEPKEDRKLGGLRASHNETVLVDLFTAALSSCVAEGRKAERRAILGQLAGLSAMWRQRYRDRDLQIDQKSLELADIRADVVEIVVAVITAQALPVQLAQAIGPEEAQAILSRARAGLGRALQGEVAAEQAGFYLKPGNVDPALVGDVVGEDKEPTP